MAAEWRPKAKQTILALSQEKLDHEVAALEWTTTGKPDMLTDTRADCELCGQQGLKERFETRNKFSGKTLWIGRNCVKKFIQVRDADGRLLDDSEKDEELTRLQVEACMKPLRALCKQVDAGQRQSIIRLVQDGPKERFGPQDLLDLFRMMHARNIDYPATFYKVNLRNKAQRTRLYQLSDDDLAMIWPALSSAQQKGFAGKKAAYKAEIAKQREAEQQRQEAERRERLEWEQRKNQRHSHSPNTRSSVKGIDKPMYFDPLRHKYRLTFFNASRQPLQILFRASIEACEIAIENFGSTLSECTYAEVTETISNKVIGTVSPNQ